VRQLWVKLPEVGEHVIISVYRDGIKVDREAYRQSDHGGAWWWKDVDGKMYFSNQVVSWRAKK